MGGQPSNPCKLVEKNSRQFNCPPLHKQIEILYRLHSVDQGLTLIIGSKGCIGVRGFSGSSAAGVGFIAKLGSKTRPNSEVGLNFEYKNWVNWVLKKLNSLFGVVDLSSEFVNLRA
jgi:hypothetical protein